MRWHFRQNNNTTFIFLIMERNCVNCRYCDLNGVVEPCCSCDINCSNFKPLTNRQWLEGLSDEEFANEIVKYTNTPFPVLSWLQAEHEE